MRTLCSVFLIALLLAIAAPVQAQVSFGASVAAAGEQVLVGEPGNLIEPGAVYVYAPASGGWNEVQRLTASDGSDGDGFGRSIAVGDGWLVIGADAAGAAYVFSNEGGAWQEVAALRSEAAGSAFGRAVALAGGAVMVGAPGHETGRGAVFVYRPTSEGWMLEATLQGEGAEEGEDGVSRPEVFGASLAADGDWLIAGAPAGASDLFLGTMFGNEPGAGSAYVFRRGDDGWVRESRLQPPGQTESAMFGSSVALRDGEAAIGAEGTESFTGAVYTYRLGDDDAWSLTGRLTAFDARPRANFGYSVSIDDDQILVGAPGAGPGRLEGRVYRFARSSSGEWTGATKLGGDDLAWGAAYGQAVSAAGDVVVAGMPGADYGAGIAVVMKRTDSGWSSSRVVSEARGLPAIVGQEVLCVDGKAGIFPCDNVDLISFLPVADMGGGRGVTANDVWGWTDPESGRNYVVQGLRDGTAFVDVTDPLRPVFVGKLPKTAASPASLWRDVKVYDHFAMVVADASGPHGVQIFDLHRLREFDGEPIMFSEDVHYDGTYSTHNLEINEESNFVYAVGNSAGGETCGGALHMIDMEDPRNPTFAGCFQPPGPGGRAVGTHDTQCVTYRGPDDRYTGREICFSSNGAAFSIGDVTDKRNPVPVALATYPNLAYTHQGWLDEEQRYFYMNDEGDEDGGLVEGTRTLVWDIQDLEDPILVTEYITDNPATDHNLYIVGDVMYQSNYRSGLRVVDISERETPKALGYFDTVPWGADDGMGDIVSGAIGSWSNYPFFASGIVAVSSSKEGLFLVRLRNAPGAGTR